MPTEINYIIGDATHPTIDGNKVIVHICNDIGGWGKGFVIAISKRWAAPETEYRLWFQSQDNFALGEAQFVKTEDDLWVANLIGQHKIKTYKDENSNVPIRYDAVAAGLHKVGQFAKEHKATVHMPRIGCGLAGGTWDKIEPLIQAALLDNDIKTYVYDFG